MFRRICVLLTLLALAGCGRPIERPDPVTLVLGQATRQEIAAKYGTPASEATRMVGAPAANAPISRMSEPRTVSDGGGFDTNTAVTGRFSIIRYSYADPADRFFASDLAGRKTLVFEFFNDRLYGYNFISNASADASNFDDAKVGGIENGRTTREEVEAMLGPPTGRGIFPASDLAPGEEQAIYQYYAPDGALKRLDLYYTPQNTVRHFKLLTRSSSGFRGAGAPSAVPIILPSGR